MNNIESRIKFLATGCEDGTVRIVNLGGDEVAQLDCSENSRVRSMRSLSAPNNDALILVVALSDGVIQFWKIPSDPKQSKKLGKEIKVGSSTHVTCMTALLSLPEPENEVPALDYSLLIFYLIQEYLLVISTVP
mmetsp:Transcript_6191/g.7518  ORF Transcript_6191/g.7518 Transcript_6191/m.7518 type:complete len:134 (+) Transcript_6191:947-1348(+)